MFSVPYRLVRYIHPFYSGLSWWRHQMETFSALLALCEGNPKITGGFPPQRPLTRSFGVFFHLRLNKRFSKQSRRRWFETPSCLLWRHCSDFPVTVTFIGLPQCHSEVGLRAITLCGVTMGTMTSQITIVYSTEDQSKRQSSSPLAFARGIHRWPVNSPRKWPVTRKCFHLMTSSWSFWPVANHNKAQQSANSVYNFGMYSMMQLVNEI